MPNAYEYDSKFRTLKPTREILSRIGNSNLIKEYVYPFQSDDPVLQKMYKEGHFIDKIVGKTLKEDGITISRELDQYNIKNGRFLLSGKQFSIGDSLETRIAIVDYDPSGNVFEVINDGSHSFYIWGDNYQNLVMKIDAPLNLDNNIRSIIMSYGNDLLGGSPNDNTLRTLRNNLENTGSLVTSYKYFPLIGVSETIDPSGQKHSFVYDDSNRLSKILDTNGNVTNTYYYNYKK